MATRSRRSPVQARRKRIWARTGINSSAITTGSPFQLDLLSDLKLALGSSWPIGCTVGPVILSGLQVRTSALVEVTPRVVLGVRTGTTLDDAVDHDPSAATAFMQDWMLWSGFPAPATASTNLVIGDGPGGVFRTGSMRKLEEVQSTLWFLAGATDTGTFNVRGYASTLVVLP